MGARHSDSASGGAPQTSVAVRTAAAVAGDSKSDGAIVRCRTSRPVSRVTALSSQLSRSLDQLNVFLPAPVQSIIVKLVVFQRGTQVSRQPPAARFLLLTVTDDRCALAAPRCGLHRSCVCVQFLWMAGSRLRTIRTDFGRGAWRTATIICLWPTRTADCERTGSQRMAECLSGCVISSASVSPAVWASTRPLALC
jgi:hypothetical protein